MSSAVQAIIQHHFHSHLRCFTKDFIQFHLFPIQIHPPHSFNVLFLYLVIFPPTLHCLPTPSFPDMIPRFCQLSQWIWCTETRQIHHQHLSVKLYSCTTGILPHSWLFYYIVHYTFQHTQQLITALVHCLPLLYLQGGSFFYSVSSISLMRAVALPLALIYCPHLYLLGQLLGSFFIFICFFFSFGFFFFSFVFHSFHIFVCFFCLFSFFFIWFFFHLSFIFFYFFLSFIFFFLSFIFYFHSCLFLFFVC